MEAVYGRTVFAMGDGTTVTCARTTKWIKGNQPIGAASPTCGHTYLEPGDYTVTATHHWALRWQGAGQSGTIPLTSTATFPLHVGELTSVITHRGPTD